MLVSHWREAGQRNLYPTPTPRLNSRFLSELSNVQFMPDPCILDISGFHVGVTGADILMHLGKEELFWYILFFISRKYRRCLSFVINFSHYFQSSTTPSVDRLGRVASHLLQQRNFYPLMPPAEELTVDANLFFKHTLMPFKPHMLVLPSELRFFVKVSSFLCTVGNLKICNIKMPLWYPKTSLIMVMNFEVENEE